MRIEYRTGSRRTGVSVTAVRLMWRMSVDPVRVTTTELLPCTGE